MNSYVQQQVRVYRNLRTKALSVQTYIPGTGWRVACSNVERIDLTDVEFISYECGRQRAVREGQKNVHSFAQGRNVPCPRAVQYDEVVVVKPSLPGVFYTLENDCLVPALRAKHVRITADGKIVASGVETCQE